MTELDPRDTALGFSSETMERRALALIGRVHNEYYAHVNRKPVYGLPGVCSRITTPLPAGCWDRIDRSPYALYGDQRWCDACIAYAGLNGTLPRPTVVIEGSAA